MGNSKRVDYLDIAKGILIITVILCHSDFPFAQYMYWFHMPAFFIISGLLYKNKLSIKSQATKFFIPYIAFSIVDMALTFMTNPQDFSMPNILYYSYEHIYSGKMMPGVFWFIPCLFLTKVLFHYGKKLLSNQALIMLLIGLYIAGHAFVLATVPENVVDITTANYIPWNLDALMITLPYYAIGYYAKDLLKFVNNKITLIISGILAISYLKLNTDLQIYYYMNIKYSEFRYYFLDLLVPITFTVFILSISYHLTQLKHISSVASFFKLAGANSLIIMYLHIPLNHYFETLFNYNYVIFTLIGLLIPLGLAILINKNELCEFIFKGTSPSSSSSKSHSVRFAH
ncbi:acyltransferase family protein [Clostridium folliculivorans]|uniref:acyltransferase family protein n=1 Tax=Clostridium folliculivorans TaxID=2886038 RepID=UPI0021C26C90|nr:acyltransferase family protein [Clostridium folliculivorans]GKU31600.1 acyltransferase [Clostridium folliculivorans]